MDKNLILCVDDEKSILDTLRALLRRAFKNYSLKFAESAEEALMLLEDHPENDFDKLVVISDWLMPGMRGDEFLVKVHHRYPNSLKIILSGLIDQSGIKKATEEANVYELVAKPWDGKHLINLIQRGIEEN